VQRSKPFRQTLPGSARGTLSEGKQGFATAVFPACPPRGLSSTVASLGWLQASGNHKPLD
jgi:hypothetical protein